MNDLLTKAGAEVLADRIVDFWARQGIQVQCRVEVVGRTKSGGDVYGVRSDIDVARHIPRAEIGAAIGLGAVEANRRRYAALLEGARHGA
ncbi:hypothetical protein ACRC7T_18175 [Segnochrobactraceae bacterium EtOH-i3]